MVVHRSDGSGTTFGFTDYLSLVSPAWQQQVGKGTSVNWPVGLGGSGNPGVAGEVQQNQYSIGYVELIYALQNGLGYGTVQNSAGNFIVPNLDSVTAAAASAAGAIPADLRFSIVNAPGESAYPISTATWLLVYHDVNDRGRGVALTRLLWWATHEAQRFNADLAYATVPAEITARSEGFIRQISSRTNRCFLVVDTPFAPGRRRGRGSLQRRVDKQSNPRPQLVAQSPQGPEPLLVCALSRSGIIERPRGDLARALETGRVLRTAPSQHDDQVVILTAQTGDRTWSDGGDIDADLTHNPNSQRVDFAGWFGASTLGFNGVTPGLTQPCLCHHGTDCVSCTQIENAAPMHAGLHRQRTTLLHQPPIRAE